MKTWKWAVSRSDRTHRTGPGEIICAVSEPWRDARPPGRADERRRAADADHRADLDGKPVPGAARRTVGRAVAEDRGTDGRRDPDHEEGRRQHRRLRAEFALRKIDLRPRVYHRAWPHVLQRHHERA